MNQEENDEKDQREERYRGAQSDISTTQKDIRQMKVQIDKLIGVVGELVVSIKGNDFGNEGLLKRVGSIEKIAQDLNERFDDLETQTERNITELGVKADKRINLLVIISTMGGAFLGIVIKWVFDSLKK